MLTEVQSPTLRYLQTLPLMHMIVCMSACVYVNVCVCVCVHTCVRVWVCGCVNMCVCGYVCVYATHYRDMHVPILFVCVRSCVCVRERESVRGCVCEYVRVYVCVCVLNVKETSLSHMNHSLTPHEIFIWVHMGY